MQVHDAMLPIHSVVGVSVPGGRFGPTVAALVGLAVVVIGWRTFRRRDRYASRPTTVIGAGAATAIAGVVFLLLADGGPGTGNGVVGSSAAVMLGVVATLLGTLAHKRADSAT